MGILDDAIREHLDLKRRHGARDVDLREIEDEAFGSTDRPDPFAANELFNEVSSTGTAEAERPDGDPSQTPGGLDEPDVGGEEPTRLVEPEALRPPEAAPERDRPDSPVEPIGPPEGLGDDEPISPPEGLEPVPGQFEI